ncbi:hypothetical protein [Candidatus Kuenenia stuttgartiensis]|nr:hypothetical protein [Candidatus Kuenenia stuttgartiensis]
MIRAYITNPQTAYKTLGYAKATMPEIKTGAEEVEFLLSFIKESANAKDN